MIYIQEIDDFMNNHYEDIKKKFWDTNNDTIPLMMEDIAQVVKQKMSQVFESIGVVLEKRKCKVGDISISFLRQSAWEKKKRALIEVFDSFEIDKKLIFTDELDVNWLFTNWDLFKEDITESVKQQGLSRIIKEPYIIWMMEKELGNLASLFHAAIKSLLVDADELESFSKLIYDDGFRITAGEYGDWQNLVFFMPPQYNIEEDTDIPLIYQHVYDMSYYGIDFKKKDLSCSKFVNCVFDSCTFEEVSLEQARFVNCKFVKVDIINSSMKQTGFIQCSLVDMDTRTSDATGAYVSECTIENVVME